MDVSGVSSGSTGAISDGLKLNQDFDQFLRLLTTQLQNQDPLEPMDATEFTNQLVQFSGVEQSIKTNGLLEDLLSVQALNMTALGVSFIGKNVEVNGDTFKMAEGQTEVTFSYSLPDTPTSGTLTIENEDGDVVYSQDIEKVAGLQQITWDGKDEFSEQVPAGNYTIKIVATGEDKASLQATTYVPGYVDSLESADNGALVLNINGKQVPLTDVRKISSG